MKFAVAVGDKERSRIDLLRNPWTGAFSVHADGRLVAQRSPYSLRSHFDFQVMRRYEFQVGRAETHQVVIEHWRPLILAGFLPQTYRVFADGRLVREVHGY